MIMWYAKASAVPFLVYGIVVPVLFCLVKYVSYL